MTTEFTKLSCEDFVAVLASKEPVPGGGGASALVGAIGMALGNMVGSLTVGKPKFADVEEDMVRLKTKSDELQQRFFALVAQDAVVFEPLSVAYGLPRETEEEKAHKAQVMEECLRECCAVPLAIMEACCEAIDVHEEFAAKGTPIAISDVGCGVIACKAALQAASLNVFINTMSFQDREYAENINVKAYAMLDEYCAKADAIFADVAARFKK
ncbi:MAG: cyclodeaminase/cyclohydrolase family protein [Coriobacteriales bacterium]|jgi:formiminotetrahydrofolate cyclodeaminase|nr:cyclodeaminase/cyclohydrolase family protein [Coriobacteriales bacterium]